MGRASSLARRGIEFRTTRIPLPGFRGGLKWSLAKVAERREVLPGCFPILVSHSLSLEAFPHHVSRINGGKRGKAIKLADSQLGHVEWDVVGHLMEVGAGDPRSGADALVRTVGRHHALVIARQRLAC